MVVHRSAWAPRAPAVLQTLRDQLGKHVFAVHRLDGGVSGCLLMATESKVAGQLAAALSSGTACKRYVALVRGYCAQSELLEGDGQVVVENPMKDDAGVVREARSVVRLLGRSQTPRCSMLEVQPITGRYHQVRRHVRDLHHPVLGDSEHGDNKENRVWRQLGLTRIGLHCFGLAFDAPEGGRVAVECPPFADHAAVWEGLPFWAEACALRPVLGSSPLHYPQPVNP